MSEESPVIPLADVLRAANELVAAGLIEDYALGGALAAIYCVEPLHDLRRRYRLRRRRERTDRWPSGHLRLPAERGSRVEREHLLVHGFPVQFLAAAAGLTEEAVHEARTIEYEGVPKGVPS